MPLRFHVSWQVPLCLPSNCIMRCLVPQAVVKTPFQHCQMKAKVQWRRPMPEEMRWSGSAKALQKEKHNVCPKIRAIRINSPLSLRGGEEPAAVSAPALLSEFLVLMLVILWAACCMVYLIYFCGPTPPPPLLLSVSFPVVVAEALKLVGWMLSVVVGQWGDAFFVLDVFGREQRC